MKAIFPHDELIITLLSRLIWLQGRADNFVCISTMFFQCTFVVIEISQEKEKHFCFRTFYFLADQIHSSSGKTSLSPRRTISFPRIHCGWMLSAHLRTFTEVEVLGLVRHASKFQIATEQKSINVWEMSVYVCVGFCVPLIQWRIIQQIYNSVSIYNCVSVSP